MGPTVTPRQGQVPGWGRVYLGLLGVFFAFPLFAMARFAFQHVATINLGWANLGDGWSANSLSAALSDPLAIEAAQRSLLLAVCTIALTLLLLVPVATYVEVRAPRWRAALVVLSILPWLVPPIALVVGVASTFRGAAPWFLSSPYSLVPFYAMWALPFSFRAIDAGLRAIDARTLYEASVSLGASWPTFFVKVVLANLSSSLVVVATLTGATVLGEFAFASLLLKQTLPTYLVVLQGGNARVGLALALMVLLVTAAIIGLAIGMLRRRGISLRVAGI